jgi:hypothetical protein
MLKVGFSATLLPKRGKSAPTLPRQRGRRPGIHPEVKCGGDVRHAGEVYRLMVMGPRNMDSSVSEQTWCVQALCMESR